MTSHADIVVDQFTRQATPFANAASMRDEEALRRLVEFSQAGAADTVLDVACGPGLVVGAFAKVVRHASGIDLTPAMIDKAREHAAALALTNVDWHVGNVAALPFADRSFSLVVSRFAFHHFVDPLAVLREMTRVATRPGRVVIADVAASDDPHAPPRSTGWSGCAIPRTPARSRSPNGAACSPMPGCRRRARPITTCAASSKACSRPRFRRRATCR